MKKRLNCFAVLFAIGGSAYGAIEVLWRGHTHWSMIITGGTCFAALYRIMIKTVSCSMTLRCCIGSAVITFFEFISGFLFNHCLKLNVWDYSDRRFNFCGQICPLYSLLWGLLTIPVAKVCSVIRKKLRL